METIPRHQCLVYEGPAHQQLRPLAAVIREKLGQHVRCLYLNSLPMLADMRSSLADAGVDVLREETNGSLILQSERPHLTDGQFNVQAMQRGLEVELLRALKDGYTGLWASGDMTWQLGPEPDVVKLIEYERGLDSFLRTHSEMSGVCQYHCDSLPEGTARLALVIHPGVFINESLSRINGEFREAVAVD